MKKTIAKFLPSPLRILRHIADPEGELVLAGDVEEEYADVRKRRGRLAAALWIWFQIVISLPSYLKGFFYWRKTMIANYARLAWRSLRKHKFFSLVNIGGLAVGMACCILIFLWVQDELSFDGFHKNREDLYRAVVRTEGQWLTTTSWALAPVLKRDFPEIEGATRFAFRNLSVAVGDNSYTELTVFVDPDFFEMFSFPLLSGDSHSALALAASAVITESTARRYFGSEDPMGKTLKLLGQWDITVTGVVNDPPTNSSLDFDLLVPVKILGEGVDTSWSYETQTYVLLGENTSVDEMRKKLAPVIMKYDRRVNTIRTLDLERLRRMHLYALAGGGSILYVYIFSTIAVFVLLMACINFMNLATARAGDRAKDVGMRKVVGALRGDVIRQYYGESLFHALISLLAAIGIVLLVLPGFNRLAEKQISFSFSTSLTLLLGLLTITIFTGLVAGSYPALFISSFHPVKVLKGAYASGTGRPRLRKILVVSQFTIAVVLIIGTLAVHKQLTYIRNKDLGFNREHVVSLPRRPVGQNYEAFKAELLRNVDVINVTAATSRPTLVGNINPVYWEGRTADQYETMNFIAADYDYIDTFEMTIVAGRDFSREFATDAENYIVNEAAVRHMGLEDPVGKLFSIWENRGKIIGVVKDFHGRPLTQEISPVVLTLNPAWSPAFVFVRMKPENVRQAMGFLRSTWNTFAPNSPFEPVFLDESFEALYRADSRRGEIFRNFALLAVFISCLGIFGLSAYSAQQRTKEIGVRKVMGASIPDIVSLLTHEFIILVTFANGVALPIAYVLTDRLLRSYAYRTDLTVWLFLAAGLAAYIIALMTVSYQAFKAARTQPADALRYE